MSKQTIKDKKQKEKIEKILDKLINEKIIDQYYMDIWEDGYIIKRNDYIAKKFNEIGIKAFPLKKCHANCGDCENFYLTEEDEEKQEVCSSDECIFEHTYIEIPTKYVNTIIDEIFNKARGE